MAGGLGDLCGGTRRHIAPMVLYIVAPLASCTRDTSLNLERPMPAFMCMQAAFASELTRDIPAEAFDFPVARVMLVLYPEYPSLGDIRV